MYLWVQSYILLSYQKGDKMKDLIKKALDDAMNKLDTITPNFKTATKSVDISDVSPMDIVSFMEENDIPDNACFDGVDNAYDGWEVGEICLSWDIEVETTDADKLKFRKKRFTGVAWNFVYRLLLDNGYKRKGYNTRFLKEFDDTTVYDMYLNKEFDRLVKYYSLPFKKIN